MLPNCFPKESAALNIPLAMYGNAFVFESHPATGARLSCKLNADWSPGWSLHLYRPRTTSIKQLLMNNHVLKKWTLIHTSHFIQKLTQNNNRQNISSHCHCSTTMLKGKQQQQQPSLPEQEEPGEGCKSHQTTSPSRPSCHGNENPGDSKSALHDDSTIAQSPISSLGQGKGLILRSGSCGHSW